MFFGVINLFLTPLFLLVGQPMSITFDKMPPRAPRRSASVPTTASLLNRIQKPPLVERLSRDDSTIKAPSGPYVILLRFSILPYVFLSLLLDALLQEDPSVTDLLVMVVVITPTSLVHPKDLKSQRPPQNSIKNSMRLWVMLTPSQQVMMLLLQVQEMLIWLERSLHLCFVPSRSTSVMYKKKSFWLLFPDSCRLYDYCKYLVLL